LRVAHAGGGGLNVGAAGVVGVGVIFCCGGDGGGGGWGVEV